MAEISLDFCDQYDYPAAVSRHFRRLLEPVSEQHVKSVLLIGGTSRGELSYRVRDGSVELFSDYEFFLIANGRPSRSFERTFRRHVRSVEKDIRLTPFFHVDFNYVSPRSIRSLDPTFFTYDVRETGIPIWGEDPRPAIPRVHPEDIDLRESNETLLWRLWSMFLYTPTSLLDGDLAEPWRTYFEYAVCKNSLDLTTWAFPQEGRLVSTYTERVDCLDREFGSFQMQSHFDEDLPEFLRDCLAGKLDLQLGDAPIDRYDDAVRHFESAISYLYSAYDSSGDHSRTRRSATPHFFRDRRPKYIARDFYYYVRYGVSSGGKTPRWLWIGKRGLTLLVLLSFHRFLRSAALGSPDVSHLKAAEQRFADLQICSPKGCDDFESNQGEYSGGGREGLIHRYEALRCEFVTFMKRYYNWISNQGDHIEKVQQAVINRG